MILNSLRKLSELSIKHLGTIRLNRTFGSVTKPKKQMAPKIDMRFVQFLRKNDTRPRLGVVSKDGTGLVELSGGSCIANEMENFLAQEISVEEIRAKIECRPIENPTDVHLLPPIAHPGKIICIGLNYKDHCKEQNKEPPKEPMFFSKFASSIIGPRDNIIAHSISNKIDWEVELAVIIGKTAKHVTKANAMDYVFGYSVAQDISARDWQKEKNGGQFLIGKSMDTFCPLGPTIVHKSEIKDPHNLILATYVNGIVKQCGSTKDMIFKIDDIIEHITKCITLNPGDVILTGTPAGVGMHRNPPEYLKPGDSVISDIELVGKLLNLVIGEDDVLFDESSIPC